MHRLAIAMPIYNEADGLEETLADLSILAESLRVEIGLYAQDDRSTDNSVQILNRFNHAAVHIYIESNANRLGHGGTVMRAYQRSIFTNPECVIQLDGDGQFFVIDVVQIFESIILGSEMTIGLRSNRTSPVYRKIATYCLRILGLSLFGINSKDLNSPIRGFNSTSLSKILSQIPNGSLIPNVYLTILGNQQFTRKSAIEVDDRPRRGVDSIGSTWRNGNTYRLLSFRFLVFSIRVLKEILATRKYWKLKKVT
jgi:glycosyltransferase involved in cell wall biosynthesis